MANRIRVKHIGKRFYEVKLNCGYPDWEVIRVKAINEYIALFKAMRGRWIRLFLLR